MIKKVFFIIIIYLFLFNPPFSFFRGLFSIGNFFVLFSIAFVLLKPRVVKRYISCFRKEYLLLIFLFVFVVLRTLMGGQKSYVAQHFLGICNIFLVIPMLLYYANRIGLRTELQIVRSLLIVGTLAASISILCLMIPSLRDFLNNNIYRYTAEDYIIQNDYRGFGFASLITSDYGYILGLIAGYGSLYLKNNRFFIVCIPFLLFAAIINARTGFLLALMIIGASLFVKKSFGYGLSIAILAIVVVSYSSSFFDVLGVSSRTSEWSMSLFRETREVLRGNTEESFAIDLMMHEMVVFPTSFPEWIIGQGHSLTTGYAGRHTDIGWFLHLNYGGVIYVIILYYFLFVILKKLRKNKQANLFWVVLIYILIINTKSSVFPGYTSLYLLFMFYAVKLMPQYQDDKYSFSISNTVSEVLV